MKYADKVKKAEAISKLLLKGNTEEEARRMLQKEDLYPNDIDKVMRSAHKIICDKYGDRIKAQMLDGTLEAHLDDYDELSAALFEKIQYEQIETIQREARKEVIHRFEQGESIEEIQKSVINNHFTESHFNDMLLSIDHGKKDTNKDRLIGVGFLAAGILLSIVSKDVMSGGFVFFYGLIFFGIYKLFTAG